ncbi:MAG: histidine kinase [Oscillospiraceae bacterium]|nr:histidine kinase [Oscillospiraceae bacterium]
MSGEAFYFSIISAALVLSVMGLLFAAVMPGIDSWSKRFFRLFFSVLLACCLSSIVDLSISGYPDMRAAKYCMLVLESLLLSIPVPMLTAYLLHCCGDNVRRSRLFHIVIGLWAAFFILLISAALFYYPAFDSQKDHRVLYAIMLLPLVAILLFNLAGLIRRRKQLSHKVYLSFLIAILPMTAALIVQMFVDVVPLLDISVVISALAMYGIVLSDQIEQDLYRQREIARQQQEIANQRASVMVLQMRPHFIYNTLMSIYSLCSQDPQKARQVTKDFTDYLRRNFNAVASDGTIPFSAELEHTRAYLAVEQVQFEELLDVEYDTPFTSFRLPPLTLQPLVENSVKHGMDPYAGPLHVLIRTRSTDDGTVITVEDNGPGFDPSDETKPHTTLENIRQRLEMMCGGRMAITPGESGGTVVTLTIPNVSAE